MKTEKLSLSTNMHKKHLFVLLVVALALVGCIVGCDRQQASEPINGGVAAPTLGVPMPTAEMLVALGPVNNVSIQHHLPDTLFVIAGRPKQFLASPVCTGGELFAAGWIAESFQFHFFDIDSNDVEFFVQSSSLPFYTQVAIPNPHNPNEVLVRDFPIARRVTVINLAKPYALEDLLGGEIDPIFLGSLRRTEGRNEYFDLTPEGEGFPQRLAFGRINDRTIVFAQGTEDDVRAVFSDTIPENAALARLRHAPVHANDLTIIASLEGLAVSPEDFERLLDGAGQELGIPTTFVTLIRQHLRALTLSLNVSATQGQPVISILVEGRNESSAEAIGGTIHGTVLSTSSSLAMMSEEMKQLLPIPPDFAEALLRNISVQPVGTRVNIALNNFATLIPTIAEFIRNQQIFIQELERRWERERLHQWRTDQLGGLAELSTSYYMAHGRFPSDILDAEGNPLLSWRVALLPMMGLRDLYDQFNLNEPWNSETNLAAMQSVPRIFHPIVPEMEPTKTVIRFFDSPGTPFANRNLRIDALERQHSTLMYFIASPEYAVEWTKPESLAFDIDRIAEIVDDITPLGVTFGSNITRRVGTIPVPRHTEPNYEFLRRYIEALVKGLPLPEQEGGER